MSETAITIVGSIDPVLEKRAALLVKEAGVEGLEITRLDSKRAIDILVKENNLALAGVLRQKLSALGPFDIFIQPNDVFRKKKLLIADMDATIIQQETLDELAAHVNLKEKVAPITEKAMRGEIDFYEALRMRVKLLRGLPLAAVMETIGKIQYSPGAAQLIRGMNRHGGKCVLVSGGFDLFTTPVAATLGFSKNFGNRLGIEDGRLTGEVIPPIVDKYVKEQLVVDQAKLLGCDLKHVVAIGDGANDILMLKKAGTGVGYFGKPAVVEATPHQIRHTDLISILYMQGYRQEEVV